MQQEDRTRKALKLLFIYTEGDFDFNKLHGNQHRQERQIINNALHGEPLKKVKGSRVTPTKLKHDLVRVMKCTYMGSYEGSRQEFVRRASEILNEIREFESFTEWTEATREAGLKLNKTDGVGEDPFTHYYAINGDCVTLGYYGNAHGSDRSCGFIAPTHSAYEKYTGKS